MVARGTGAAVRTQQELGERSARAAASVAGLDPGADPRRQHQCARGDEVSGAARARERRGGAGARDRDDAAEADFPTSRCTVRRLAAGTERTRELIVQSPQIYLQAQATQATAPPSATQRFLQDLGALGGIARRAHRILEGRLLAQLRESELLEVTNAFARANAETLGDFLGAWALR
jgi:hypothetical protein